MATTKTTHVLQVKGSGGDHLDLMKYDNPDAAASALKEHQTKFPHHEPQLVTRTSTTEDSSIPTVKAPKPAAKKETAKPVAKAAPKPVAKKEAVKPDAKKVAAKPAAKKAAPKKDM